jgi:hypothetical protein
MSDKKYRDESYLGDAPANDEEEPTVQDLGFIVDDRDDRRIQLVDNQWERLEELDTDEGIGVNEEAPLPVGEEDGSPPAAAFATDYNLNHLEAEEQEADFVETSMLAVDPEGGAGADDFTSNADLDGDGRLETTDIAGRARGVTRGFGTSLPMDIGAEGFEVRDNPLMQPIDPDQPISGRELSDVALGERYLDEMGDDEELNRLAERAAEEMERRE